MKTILVFAVLICYFSLLRTSKSQQNEKGDEMIILMNLYDATGAPSTQQGLPASTWESATGMCNNYPKLYYPVKEVILNMMIYGGG